MTSTITGSGPDLFDPDSLRDAIAILNGVECANGCTVRFAVHTDDQLKIIRKMAESSGCGWSEVIKSDFTELLVHGTTDQLRQLATSMKDLAGWL